jgi:hypothetical protein
MASPLLYVYCAALQESLQMILGLGISTWEVRAVPDWDLKRMTTALDVRVEALMFCILMSLAGFAFSA